jgi:hypothetical protein
MLSKGTTSTKTGNKSKARRSLKSAHSTNSKFNKPTGRKNFLKKVSAALAKGNHLEIKDRNYETAPTALDNLKKTHSTKE